MGGGGKGLWAHSEVLGGVASNEAPVFPCVPLSPSCPCAHLSPPLSPVSVCPYNVPLSAPFPSVPPYSLCFTVSPCLPHVCLSPPAHSPCPPVPHVCSVPPCPRVRRELELPPLSGPAERKSLHLPEPEQLLIPPSTPRDSPCPPPPLIFLRFF